MTTTKHSWIEVDEEIPFAQWWAQFVKNHRWAEPMLLEKWSGGELRWPQLVDSARSFTLFARQKVLLVQQADKAFKGVKKADEVFKQIKQCPHVLLLVSSEKAPPSWPFEYWKAPVASTKEAQEKAIFRWIDKIDRADLKACLRELELSLDSGQHPLACLQLITRHYRMGRMISYAYKKGLSQTEIRKVFRVPSFVIEKWHRKSPFSSTQWEEIFSRLSQADLFLKSGFDDRDVLTKLSHDLCQIKRVKPKRNRFTTGQPLSLFGSPLWQAATSFS